MKFINYLESITGISIFPLISLLIFFVFFVGVTWWVYSTPKKELQKQAGIPLDH